MNEPNTPTPLSVAEIDLTKDIHTYKPDRVLNEEELECARDLYYTICRPLNQEGDRAAYLLFTLDESLKENDTLRAQIAEKDATVEQYKKWNTELAAREITDETGRGYYYAGFLEERLAKICNRLRNSRGVVSRIKEWNEIANEVIGLSEGFDWVGAANGPDWRTYHAALNAEKQHSAELESKLAAVERERDELRRFQYVAVSEGLPPSGVDVDVVVEYQMPDDSYRRAKCTGFVYPGGSWYYSLPIHNATVLFYKFQLEMPDIEPRGGGQGAL